MLEQSNSTTVKTQRGVKIKAPLRRKLLLFCVSLMVSIVLAEIAVRVVKPGFPGFRIPQVEHRITAGVGFEMIPNQQGYTFAEPVTVNSNGFRGPEIAEGTADGGVRIVCLGDSITFGVGVSDEMPYPKQLERSLSHAIPNKSFELINAGVQRYFTYQEIDQLRKCVGELKPDIVILGVYCNDLGVRPQGNYTREYENEREQVVSSIRKKVPWIYLMAKNSALVTLFRNSYLSHRHGTSYMQML